MIRLTENGLFKGNKSQHQSANLKLRDEEKRKEEFLFIESGNQKKLQISHYFQHAILRRLLWVGLYIIAVPILFPHNR
ncbi:MAG TPA: hypothetical protein VFI73_02465 [Candidatus Nitrosopolaris sp.]|nr:hypothetical protein [Candidatus Nitrosopolaris sp.]